MHNFFLNNLIYFSKPSRILIPPLEVDTRKCRQGFTSLTKTANYCDHFCSLDSLTPLDLDKPPRFSINCRYPHSILFHAKTSVNARNIGELRQRNTSYFIAALHVYAYRYY